MTKYIYLPHVNVQILVDYKWPLVCKMIIHALFNYINTVVNIILPCSYFEENEHREGGCQNQSSNLAEIVF